MVSKKDNLSKHLIECFECIKKLEVTEFTTIDVYPSIKRGDWVFGKLEDAGLIERIEGKVYRIKIN